MPFRSLDAEGICVFGAEGSLGGELMNVFGMGDDLSKKPENGPFVQARSASSSGISVPGFVKGFSRNDCDITRPAGVSEILGDLRPGIVINCAAYTDVDGAESNPDAALELNVRAVENLAREARRIGAGLIHFSTDFVYERVLENIPEAGFDETVEPFPPPVGRYALTKLQGENLALANNPGKTLVLRTGNLYGRYGGNFASKLPGRLKNPDPDLIIDNVRIMAPTWTGSLAFQTAYLVEQNPDGGIYHATCNGKAVWADFAAEICRLLNIKPAYRTGSTQKPTLSAPRPKFHVLKNHRLQTLGMDIMPHWKDALAESLGV